MISMHVHYDNNEVYLNASPSSSKWSQFGYYFTSCE